MPLYGSDLARIQRLVSAGAREPAGYSATHADMIADQASVAEGQLWVVVADETNGGRATGWWRTASGWNFEDFRDDFTPDTVARSMAQAALDGFDALPAGGSVDWQATSSGAEAVVIADLPGTYDISLAVMRNRSTETATVALRTRRVGSTEASASLDVYDAAGAAVSVSLAAGAREVVDLSRLYVGDLTDLDLLAVGTTASGTTDVMVTATGTTIASIPAMPGPTDPLDVDSELFSAPGVLSGDITYGAPQAGITAVVDPGAAYVLNSTATHEAVLDVRPSVVDPSRTALYAALALGVGQDAGTAGSFVARQFAPAKTEVWCYAEIGLLSWVMDDGANTRIFILNAPARVADVRIQDLTSNPGWQANIGATGIAGFELPDCPGFDAVASPVSRIVIPVLWHWRASTGASDGIFSTWVYQPSGAPMVTHASHNNTSALQSVFAGLANCNRGEMIREIEILSLGFYNSDPRVSS